MIEIRIKITDSDYADGDVTTATYEMTQQLGGHCVDLGRMLGDILNSARDNLIGNVEDVVSGMQSTLHDQIDNVEDTTRLLAIAQALRPLWQVQEAVLNVMPLDSQMRRDWLKVINAVNTYLDVDMTVE